MRRILFNQAKFNNVETKERLLELYTYYLKLNGREKDVEDAVKFSVDYYKSNNAFPSDSILTEKFKFQFDTIEIQEETRFGAYLTDKMVDFRDRTRRALLVQLQTDQTMSSEKRLEILDELVRIETDVFNDDKEEVKTYDEMDLKETYERFKNRGGGIKTNIPDIDALTLGISSGKMAVLFAPPGSFKTSTALNMMYINLLEGDNTLFLSLEIPKNEVQAMMTVRHSYSIGKNLTLLPIIKGLLSPAEETITFETDADFKAKKKGKFVIMDSDDLKIDTIVSFRTQLLDMIKAHDIKTIYIDFIQQFKDFDIKGFDDERILLNKIVSVLRHISVTRDVRIIILSQANRAGYDFAERNDGTMKMTNISEISNLERYAYYIISLYSNDQLKMANQLKVGLVKHRGGETMQEARNTFVLPSYFVVGNVEQNYADVVSYKEERTGDGFDVIDIFTGGE